ncbi:MAG: hypothetical protein HDS09_05595 [Bacteroides sp.]|nr:hypothetical protein [Bacteroides sp.]
MKEDLFNEIKKRHPEWSDEQVWIAVSLDQETDRVIEKAGADVDMNDGGIFIAIIEGAREWLRNQLPYIFDKVKDVFANFLAALKDNIKYWVTEGLNYLLKSLIKSFP